MYTIKVTNPVKDIFINAIEKSRLSKELIKEKLGDIHSGWKDWEVELPVEYRIKLEKIPILEKAASNLLIERNKLIAERDARPNIANEEWAKKQNEVLNLANELKETKIKYDKIFDLCLKLIEKIPTEKKNSSFQEKMEKIKLVLGALAIPASVILSEFLKRNNKNGS